MLLRDAEAIGAVTARHWLAAMAMQGILAAEGVANLEHRDSQKAIATAAYQMADAMLEASKSLSA